MNREEGKENQHDGKGEYGWAKENHLKEMGSLYRKAMEKKMKAGIENVILGNSDDNLSLLPKNFFVYNKNG